MSSRGKEMGMEEGRLAYVQNELLEEHPELLFQLALLQLLHRDIAFVGVGVLVYAKQGSIIYERWSFQRSVLKGRLPSLSSLSCESSFWISRRL